MTVEVVIDGGEVIEVEEGPESLARAASMHLQASQQIKLWEREKAIQARILEALQEDTKATYETATGAVVVTKRGPSMSTVINARDLADVELTAADAAIVIAAAKSFDWQAIDPGLRGSKPESWKPKTTLGMLVKELAQQVPSRAGFVMSEPAIKLAEGS